MKKYIRAYIDREQEQKYAALGREVESRFIHYNIDTYLASAYPDDDGRYVLSFWFDGDDYTNARDASRYACGMDEFSKVELEEYPNDNGYMLNCYCFSFT